MNSNYPLHLLPQPHFKKIVYNEHLNNCYLIHFTGSKDIIDPHDGKLHIDFVVRQTDHLRDYSNNLLGFFLVDDIFWEPQPCDKKEFFQEDWNEGDRVVPPEVPTEYNRNENRGYFFLRIGGCHGQTVHFEDNSFVNPVCTLLHTPTKSNFWHFSLRWYFDGKDIEKWTDGVKRRMKTHAKTFIIERASFNEPFYQELDKDIYCIGN